MNLHASAIRKSSQLFQDLIIEAYSLLRWFWVYHLPKILAKPFLSSLFRTSYFILLIILILLFIISIPIFWGEFFTNILIDLWIKYIGEESAKLGVQWITGLPVTLFLFIWVVYSLIANLWAKPRWRFLEMVKGTLHLQILRGGGRRVNFLFRLNETLNGGLAPGPIGEFLQAYFPVEEYSLMLEKTREIHEKHYPKGILICAPSTAGKTRTALELIADLNPSLVVVWPREVTGISFLDLPRWKGFLVILADNLALGASPDEGGIPFPLHQLLQRCSRVVLIATLRSQYCREEIRDIFKFNIAEKSDSSYYLSLAKAVALAEYEAGRQSSVEEILGRYNGYPGSLVAGVDAMRDAYNQLPEEERAFLQVTRLLWELGIRRLTADRVWNGYEDVIGQRLSSFQQPVIMKNLEKKGFYSLVGGAQDRISMHDSILEQVILPLSPFKDMRRRLEEGFLGRQDSAAFLEISYNYWQFERYAEALMYLDRLLELQSDSAFSLSLRGDTYRRLERYDEALADFDCSLELQHDSAFVLGLRGDTYMRMGRYDEALADFSRSLELQQDSTLVLCLRSETYRRMGRNNEALADLNRAVEWTKSRKVADTFPPPGHFPPDSEIANAVVEAINHSESSRVMASLLASMNAPLQPEDAKSIETSNFFLPDYVLPPHPEEVGTVHIITVIFRASADMIKDNLRIRQIYGTLIAFPGKDRFSFQVFERGRGYLVEFPNFTTNLCPELLIRLRALVPADQLRIEPIRFQ